MKYKDKEGYMWDSEAQYKKYINAAKPNKINKKKNMFLKKKRKKEAINNKKLKEKKSKKKKFRRNLLKNMWTSL